MTNTTIDQPSALDQAAPADLITRSLGMELGAQARNTNACSERAVFLSDELLGPAHV